MNSFIEILNQSGGNFLNFVWPMLWQSSLLILVLIAFELLFRRKVRASVRYSLWLILLVKLCVPPTLALPTSPAWWLHKASPPIVARHETHYTVTYDNSGLPQIPQISPPAFVPPKPVMNLAAWLLMISTAISAALLVWLLVRWWQITRQVRRAQTSERLAALADEAKKIAGMKFKVQVKLTTNSMSPAVCGLFQPAILIPQSLVENFSDEQLRAVLVHELIHLRRRDVWVNFLQALLQIFYWWHPLVWLANARIRRVREEAVDDAVMLTLRDESESYAPTLLEVAKLALNRPLAGLGLVGILESRHALRQRIERLVDFCPPRKAGLTLVSLLGILAFAAVAVPMGGAPEKTTDSVLVAVTDVSENLNQTNSIISTATDLSNNTNTVHDWITVPFKINDLMDGNKLKKILQDAGVKMPPTVYLYMDNGILLVRGPKEQVALVNRVMLKLNGFPQKDIEASDRRFVSQWGAIKAEDSTNLFERAFKVNELVFVSVLKKATGLQTTNASMMTRSFFSKLGVDLESPKGKSVFYNDKLGLLFVRATDPDLDLIERAIQALNQVPLQIHIKARFIEVAQEDDKASGFDWYLGPFNASNNVAGKGGGSSSPAVPVSAANPLGAFPGNATPTIGGLSNSAPAIATLTGILTYPNFRNVLHALENRPGAKILGEPAGTTSSGRQMQMRATKIINVITNENYQENDTTNSTIMPQVEQVETGPVLDTVAYVLSDGYTINLTVTASDTEFLGYDKTTNSTTAFNATGERTNAPVALPRFNVRQASANMDLWDGQTVVLGNLHSEVTVGGKKVDAKQNVENKELLVFITVTTVDPAGNRIHSDDEMPFAKNGVPAQPNH